MIKIDRSKEPCPPSLLTAGVTERDRNIQIIENGLAEKLSFQAYKNADVAEALERLFNKKCAYCESEFFAVTPADIEHFRPKSRTITKRMKNPKFIGYYWLAADWDNLLLSCPNCNRRKTHSVPGSTKKVTIGKHEQFPLSDEKYRCTRHGNNDRFQQDEQSRLLINPCKDNPERYFVYTDKNSPEGFGIIKAKGQLSAADVQRVIESIRVYALHRIDLVKTRAKHVDDIYEKILVINHAIENFNKAKKAIDKKKEKDFIKGRIDKLVSMALPEAEYSAMSKQIIGAYLASLDADIKALIDPTGQLAVLYPI